LDIIVVGAGVTGAVTAWELTRAGHQVLVIDEASGPAQGASYANGAQISPSEAVPWASPENLRRAFKWMWQKDSPFRLKLSTDTRQWSWLARFLSNCRTSVWQRNAAEMVDLSLASQRRLAEIREITGIDYDREDRGILRVYRTKDEVHAVDGFIREMQARGVSMTALDREAIAEVEPALTPALERGEIAGGVLAPGDETGDARAFTAGMVELAEAEGAEFQWNASCSRIETHEDRFSGLETPDGLFRADAMVLCAGLGSPHLTRRLGFDLPIFPLKGYSLTRSLASGNAGPRISVTDESRRMVISRLGDRIRAAGKADLIGYDPELRPDRVASLRRDLDRLYPELDYRDEPEAWTGLRPMTPDGIPLIGPSPVRGLWLNTGHGSLGWTMACGSAARLVEMIGDSRH